MAWAATKQADALDVGDVLADGRVVEARTPSGTRYQDVTIDGLTVRYRNDYLFGLEPSTDWMAVVLRRLTQSVTANVADETLATIAAVKAEYGVT